MLSRLEAKARVLVRLGSPKDRSSLSGENWDAGCFRMFFSEQGVFIARVQHQVHKVDSELMFSCMTCWFLLLAASIAC